MPKKNGRSKSLRATKTPVKGGDALGARKQQREKKSIGYRTASGNGS